MEAYHRPSVTLALPCDLYLVYVIWIWKNKLVQLLIHTENMEMGTLPDVLTKLGCGPGRQPDVVCGDGTPSSNALC